MAISRDQRPQRQSLVDTSDNAARAPNTAAAVTATNNEQHNNSVHSLVTDYDFGDWLDGAELNSRISPARRFFSLFVTFDALLCTVLWLVCLVLSGENIVAAVRQQVLHYSISTSLFDVVAAAFARFLFLVLVYVACKSDHWLAVAASTACTSLACMFKIVYFSWHAAVATVSTFQATLMVVFFILGWLEVWLLDNKVVPQERRARLVVARRYGLPCGVQQPAPLTSASSRATSGRHLRDFLSTCTGSVANFYSPMASPAGSENGSGGQNSPSAGPHYLDERLLQLRVCAENSCRAALDVVNAADWQRECQLGEADFLYWRRADDSGASSGRSERRTQFKFTCRVTCAADCLAEQLVFNCDQCVSWNSAIASCELLERVDQRCHVRCQHTTPLLGGAVSPRCFVQLVLTGQKGLTYFTCSSSVQHETWQPRRGSVRAITHPSIVTVRPCVRLPLSHCVVEWLIDTDCRPGLLVPRRVIDRGTVQAARTLYNDLQSLGTRLSTDGSVHTASVASNNSVPPSPVGSLQH